MIKINCLKNDHRPYFFVTPELSDGYAAYWEGINCSLSNSYTTLAHPQLTFSGKIISAVIGFIHCYGFLLWLFQSP
jgi:hypothetical protein